MTAPPLVGAQFPPGYDRAGLLRPLRHSAVTNGVGGDSGASYRRAVTARNPMLFWLLYLRPYFTDQTTGEINFAEFHMSAARDIARWREPGPSRLAVAAWRQAGKSTCYTLGGLVWALAHRYIQFPHLFSLTDYMVDGKLRRVLRLLRGQSPVSPLLLADFPHLRLVRSVGRRYELAGGQLLVGRSMRAGTLGEVDLVRPDALIIDDALPIDSSIGESDVLRAKAAIRTGILPMGSRAHTVLLGTVMMLGDPMHDVVCEALGQPTRSVDGDRGWLRAERFTCRYFPLDHPLAGFTPEVVAGMRARAAAGGPADLRVYAMKNEPHLLGTSATARYWPVEGGWQYGWKWRDFTERRVISVDRAYGKTATSDKTALAVLCVDTSRRRVCVEHVEQGQLTDSQINERIRELHEWTKRLHGPPADTVLIEAVRDGEEGIKALGPYPLGLRPKGYRVQVPKADRIEELHKAYVARAVWHLRELEAYEAQCVSWHRKARRDDMLDAVAAGDRFLRTGKADM